MKKLYIHIFCFVVSICLHGINQDIEVQYISFGNNKLNSTSESIVASIKVSDFYENQLKTDSIFNVFRNLTLPI